VRTPRPSMMSAFSNGIADTCARCSPVSVSPVGARSPS
jgi:hypothetical protein